MVLIELKKFFEIVYSLAQQSPYAIAIDPSIKTTSKATPVFIHSNEALRGRSVGSTEVLHFLYDILAFPHKDLVYSFWGEFDIFCRTKPQIGHYSIRVSFQSFFKVFQC